MQDEKICITILLSFLLMMAGCTETNTLRRHKRAVYTYVL